MQMAAVTINLDEKPEFRMITTKTYKVSEPGKLKIF